MVRVVKKTEFRGARVSLLRKSEGGKVIFFKVGGGRPLLHTQQSSSSSCFEPEGAHNMSELS